MTPAPQRRIPWSIILRTGVSTGVLCLLATRVDWQRVMQAFRTLKFEYWMAAFGLYIVCQLLCCVRWQWLSRPLGFFQPLSRYTGIYFVGMFFNLFLPTSVGGDAVRAVYLANGTGRRMGAFLSVLLDRVSGLMVLLAVACATDLISPVPLPWQFRVGIWSAGLSAVAGLLLLKPVTNYLANQSVPQITGQPTRWNRFVLKLQDLAAALGQSVTLLCKRPKLLLGVTGLSLIVQALNVVLVWLVGQSIHLEVPLLYYGIAYPMVTLLTLAPVSLNGMGVREGGMVLFLGAAGASPGDAVSLAFLWFCVQSAASLVGAVVYLLGRFPRLEDSGEALGSDSDQGRARQSRAAA